MKMDLMRFSVWFGEVSCGLFELVSSLESSPEGTGIGRAVAITRSSPTEKATGLKAPAEGRRAAVSRPHGGGSCAAGLWPPASLTPAHTPLSARPGRQASRYGLLHLLVQREFIAGFLQGDGALFPSWWA